MRVAIKFDAEGYLERRASNLTWHSAAPLWQHVFL